MATNFLALNDGTSNILLNDAASLLQLNDTLEAIPCRAVGYPVPKRPPSNVWIGTLVVAIPLTLLSIVPNNQTEWPNPRGYEFPVSLRTHTQSFSLPASIPPRGNKDWPNPRGYEHPVELRTWINSLYLVSTPAQVIPPFHQNGALPNPRGYPPTPFDWQARFSLPLNTAADPEIRQYDWPNPRSAEPRKGHTHPALTFATFVNTPPISTRFWGLPPRGQVRHQDWQHHILPLFTANVPLDVVRNYDWPNPLPRRGLYASIATLANDTNAVAPYPKNQYDWPVPKGREHSHAGFIYPPLTFATFVNTPPISTRFWGLPPPRPPRVVADWIWPTPLVYISVAQEKPVAQYDWPNPRGYRRHQDWQWPTRIALGVAQFKPHSQRDWPNPRGKEFVAGFTQRGLGTVVENVAPVGRQRDWPNPRGKKGVVADWVKGYPRTFATFVNTPPVSTRFWALPPVAKVQVKFGFEWPTWPAFIPQPEEPEPEPTPPPNPKIARTTVTRQRTHTSSRWKRTRGNVRGGRTKTTVRDDP